MNSFSEKMESNKKELAQKFDADRAELDRQLEERQSDNVKIQKEMDKMGKILAEDKEAFLRLKTYLVAQISDYAKELDFWRDTVRKVIYQSTKDKKAAETLIEQVTESLKTYHTRELNTSINTIVQISTLLAESQTKTEK